jgi:hypothetical protein
MEHVGRNHVFTDISRLHTLFYMSCVCLHYGSYILHVFYARTCIAVRVYNWFSIAIEPQSRRHARIIIISCTCYYAAASDRTIFRRVLSRAVANRIQQRKLDVKILVYDGWRSLPTGFTTSSESQYNLPSLRRNDFYYIMIYVQWPFRYYIDAARRSCTDFSFVKCIKRTINRWRKREKSTTY